MMLANLEANMADPDAYDEKKWEQSLKAKPMEFEGEPVKLSPLSDHGLEQTGQEGDEGEALKPEEGPKQGTEQGAKPVPKASTVKPKKSASESVKGKPNDASNGAGGKVQPVGTASAAAKGESNGQSNGQKPKVADRQQPTKFVIKR